MLIGVFFGLAAAITFGLLDTLISYVSRVIGIWYVLVLAQIVSAILLFMFLEYSNRIQMASPLILLLIGVSIGGANTLANLSLYNGLAIGPVALVSPIAASYGLVTALFAVILKHEHLYFFQTVGIIIIFTGIILTVEYKQLSIAKMMQKHLGLFYGLGAMLGFGVEFFLLSIVSFQFGAIQPLLLSRTLSSIMLLVVSKSAGVKGWGKITLKTLSVIFLVGLLDTIGMIFYDSGTLQAPASVIAPISSIYTLIPLFFGVLFYREKLTLLQWFGLLTIISGVLLLAL